MKQTIFCLLYQYAQLVKLEVATSILAREQQLLLVFNDTFVNYNRLKKEKALSFSDFFL